MDKLKYVVNIGRYGDYQFIFDNAESAVAFAITAKLKNYGKAEISIDFVGLEEYNDVNGESDNEEAAQSSETEN